MEAITVFLSSIGNNWCSIGNHWKSPYCSMQWNSQAEGDFLNTILTKKTTMYRKLYTIMHKNLFLAIELDGHGSYS